MRCVLRFPKGIGSRVSGVTSYSAVSRSGVVSDGVGVCAVCVADPRQTLRSSSVAVYGGHGEAHGRLAGLDASLRPKRQPGPLWCAPSVSGGRFWRGLVVFPALRLAVVARQGRGFGNVHGACNTWTFVSNVRLW